MTKRGKYVRTNYRITGAKLNYGDLESLLVRFSWYDSFSRPITVSMGGYGYPSLLWVAGASAISGTDTTAQTNVFATQSFSGSIGFVVVHESSVQMTATMRMHYIGLVASR